MQRRLEASYTVKRGEVLDDLRPAYGVMVTVGVFLYTRRDCLSWEEGIMKRYLIAAGLLLCMNLAHGVHNSEHVYQIDDDAMGKWRRQQEDQRREAEAERRHREQMRQREYLEEQRRRDEAFRAQQERDRQRQQREYDRFWER